MSENETVENMRAAVTETNELNSVSQPLGYAVTCQPGAGVGDDDPARRRFNVHRIDHPVGHGPSFDNAAEVRAHLDRLAKLPRWRLDLDDESVTFDSTKLTITDKQSGESFSLKGWKSFGISGMASAQKAPGASVGVRHISVAAEEPPTVGRWNRWDGR
ncbi:hypothetical protein [Mycobacterium noviomagense]|uniref:Uncharacterized protein n=1 Tax=Mycobacterium noviomagense TaxID=459858 RepID=A0A7I7PIE2_9MYCO|nr:hypothetical protein [Mycobacterium noviomagense]ORB17408.1 hypothetical protein BST37_04305 [Mycobacterium noviomagense]BBY08407.1 hypothetical protein MNVI_37250 [Mycobacterium noviomagense]